MACGSNLSPAGSLFAPPHILALSALNWAALADAAEALSARLLLSPDDLASVLRSAALTQGHHDVRLCVVGRSANDIACSLAAFARRDSDSNLYTAPDASPAKPIAGWVFSGQGPLWSGMGLQLYRCEPAFRDKLDEIESLMQTAANLSILGEINAEGAASRLDRTEVSQPAVFSLQVALAALLASWGIRPAMIVGHCVGEVAAAHVAGVLPLQDAARLVCERARIAEKARGLGRLAPVELQLDEAAALLSGVNGSVDIAAINGPRSLTLSGPTALVSDLCERLTAEGRFARVLDIAYPFHGRLIDPLLAEMSALSEGTPVSAPETAFYSTVFGRRVGLEDFTPDYWARNLRETVRFESAIEAMSADGCGLFVEISTHPVLSYAIKQVLASKRAAGDVLTTMRRGGDESLDLRGCAGAHFVRGVDLDRTALAPESDGMSSLSPAHPPSPRQSDRNNGTAGAGERTAPSARVGLRDALAAETHGPARRQIVEGCIRERLAEIVRAPAASFDARETFNVFGLDSLTALELRNGLELDTGLKLSAAVIFNHPTIAGLATELAARLGTPLDPASEDDEMAALLAALQGLPEEDALRLLGAESSGR